MAQNRLSSVTTVGLVQRIDDNFTELYAAVSSVNAVAVAASAAAASASAAVTALGSGTWAAYSATCASGGGTITTAATTAAQMTLGKTVFFRVEVVISNAGTGSGALLVTLPATANADTVAVARVGTSTASAGTGLINAAATQVSIKGYNNQTAIVAGTVICAGVYEKQ